MNNTTTTTTTATATTNKNTMYYEILAVRIILSLGCLTTPAKLHILLTYGTSSYADTVRQSVQSVTPVSQSSESLSQSVQHVAITLQVIICRQITHAVKTVEQTVASMQFCHVLIHNVVVVEVVDLVVDYSSL